MAKRSKTRRELWIIKAGSQMVIEGGPRLIANWMKQVDELSERYGVDVIWVTSGAIATAKRSKVKILKKKSGLQLAEKQALSALGQPMIMEIYKRALSKRGRLGSQVLLTADDLSNRHRRTNLVQTLSTLLEWRILPILNENDAVSTEEIQFGDNDRLSALVAGHMVADRLVLLTDVEGLYDSDPKKNPKAKKISELKTISKALVKSLSPVSISGVGTGGMLSKILAAQTSTRRGITTHLVKGDHPNALLKIAREAKNKAKNNSKNYPGTLIQGKRR